MKRIVSFTQLIGHHIEEELTLGDEDENLNNTYREYLEKRIREYLYQYHFVRIGEEVYGPAEPEFVTRNQHALETLTERFRLALGDMQADFWTKYQYDLD